MFNLLPLNLPSSLKTPDYRMKKRRCKYLKSKLNHIKKRVSDYDRRAWTTLCEGFIPVQDMTEGTKSELLRVGEMFEAFLTPADGRRQSYADVHQTEDSTVCLSWCETLQRFFRGTGNKYSVFYYATVCIKSITCHRNC